MKKRLIPLICLGLMLVCTNLLAAEGGEKGASSTAQERASENAIFNRVSDWFATVGKSPEEKAKILEKRRAARVKKAPPYKYQPDKVKKVPPYDYQPEIVQEQKKAPPYDYQPEIVQEQKKAPPYEVEPQPVPQEVKPGPGNVEFPYEVQEQKQPGEVAFPYEVQEQTTTTNAEVGHKRPYEVMYPHELQEQRKQNAEVEHKGPYEVKPVKVQEQKKQGEEIEHKGHYKIMNPKEINGQEKIEEAPGNLENPNEIQEAPRAGTLKAPKAVKPVKVQSNTVRKTGGAVSSAGGVKVK